MLIGAMLVRNEEGRYLERVLEQMAKVCGKIIVEDDASEDNTPEICKAYGAEVTSSIQSYWGTDELRQRKRLWAMVKLEVKKNDWILCLDADETLTNPEKLREAIMFADLHPEVDAIAFPLYDMWDETHYRDDEHWNAHTREWVMCVKYDPNREYVWRETPLHCGRFPLNACTNAVMVEGMAIQHWGWSRAPDREAKYKRYMAADPEGKSGSLAQYRSILDPEPVLRRFEG